MSKSGEGSNESGAAYAAALRSRKWSILGFILVAAVLGSGFFALGPEGPTKMWQGVALRTWFSDLLDPVLTLGTFIVAVAVWLRTVRARWENELLQGLDVTFVVQKQGEPVNFLVVRTLPLTDPADIRPLAQQALSRWNRGHFDGLGLNMTVTNGRPQKRTVKDDQGKQRTKWIRLWKCRYPLDSRPEGACNNAACDSGAGHLWELDPFDTTVGRICKKERRAEQPVREADGDVE